MFKKKKILAPFERTVDTVPFEIPEIKEKIELYKQKIKDEELQTKLKEKNLKEEIRLEKKYGQIADKCVARWLILTGAPRA